MDVPSFREFAALRLAKAARTRSTDRPAATNRLANFLRLVLHLAGFVLLTVAAFQFSMIAGYGVAGLSCFVLSTLTTNTATVVSEQRG